MALNLYDIHPDPENAPGYTTRYDDIPEFVWQRYRDQPKELKKREKAFAKDAKYACMYACYTLQGPFPLGEAAIAKDAQQAFYYADRVLGRPFPAGEAALAKVDVWSHKYAYHVLKLPDAEAKNWSKQCQAA